VKLSVLPSFTLGFLLAVGAAACDTPVYRFAMYSPGWAPWPYEVVYVHAGEEAADDAAAVKRLEEAASAQFKLSNLSFRKLDASDEQALSRESAYVRELCQARRAELPLFVVAAPHGPVLHAGRLAEADAESLLDSPARKQLCKLLAGGKIVFVLLEGKSPADNEAAEKTARQVAEKAGRGEIEVPPPGKNAPAALVPGKEPPAKLEVAILRVPRDDQRERWFVRMLMQVEGDLEKYADHPLVFPVFGRGRALPPYATLKGITLAGLSGELSYIGGPCTCEDRHLNPGVDLLTTWDWAAAAEALAKQFGDDPTGDDLPGVAALVPTLSKPDDDAEMAVATKLAAELAARDAGSAPAPASAAPLLADVPPPPSTPSSKAPSPFRWWIVGVGAAAGILAAIAVAAIKSLRRFG
jgi:hypothetical protein